MGFRASKILLPKSLGLGLLLLSLLHTSFLQAKAQIEGVRLWRAPDHTRVVFDLSGPLEHKLFSLENPHRLVLDMESAGNQFALADIDLSKTPIRRIRSGARDKHDLRVVLDLNEQVKPRSFLLKSHGDKPDRLVLDLFDKNLRTEKKLEQSQPSQKRDIIIAVDAGHGGEDPGAIGPGRLREKNVVMAISKELVRQINQVKGYKGKLVRTGDYYIGLRKRRNIARDMRADLFISVHADAFKHPSASGASVFALSRRGATSETARFLARKENEADLIGGVGGVSLEDKDEVLAGVLVDLSMTASLSSSLQVGDKVLKSMGKIAKLHKRRVEQAGFAVLKSPDVPSILVETGFISNPKEAKNLGSSRYRKKMASQIFKGVRTYFDDKPPVGTYLAWVKNGKQNGRSKEYIIASGDTLSGIAVEYKTSVAAIKKANKLSSSRIRVGQRLKIPTS
ncbi:N-acetylmuramoyl-L-alanine amidase [uncultured Pseudoteredinibacter sp.]|uniref:N-acetylmuramoyl-L-alanine amidase n=1 Tax=uncultured Pseudoteredinibacter sp. TaxID=1641701 RepID=UPI002622CC9D|nr:N-acetylmuramoyl-L-alanine amidase [uncultured Pseudoteredinibacter sp.]